MRKYLGVFCVAFVACGNMGSGGGGGNGGTGGGASGGSGGGASGGGGAGGSGGVPDYTSGSRIKARTLSTSDGARAFAGFYDTQLSTACAFSRAADDAVRCLPTTVGYVGTYFADSGCATPLAYVFGCTSTYAIQTESTTTCVDVGYSGSIARTHVYSVGALFSGQAYVGNPGACSMTTPSYPVYSVGSELPASTFAAGSVDIAP